MHWLRHVLPDPVALVVESGTVRLSDGVVIIERVERFEAALAEAARLQGDDRLAATLDALAIYERGDYLPGARTGWADDRRQLLAGWPPTRAPRPRSWPSPRAATRGRAAGAGVLHTSPSAKRHGA